MRSLLYKKPHHTGKLRDEVFKEGQKKIQKRYYEQNKEKVLDYFHKYYETNKAKYQEYAKTQYLKNREQRIKAMKIYYQKKKLLKEVAKNE